MKLTNIGLYSNNAEVANFSFRDPGSTNPYIATQIHGLDADEIVPKFYGTGSISSDKYFNASLVKRDIVIRVSLNPEFGLNKTYSDLRDDLYKAMYSSRTGLIQLRLNDGLSTVASLSGFVTKFEAPQFSNTPEVQISMRCKDPMIKAFNPVNVNVFDLGTDITIKNLESTAPHGFKFKLTLDEAAVGFLIREDSTDIEWELRVDHTFILDDELYCSSERGDVYLYVVRSGVTTHLVDKVVPGSMWPILFPGFNDFNVVPFDGVDAATDFTWDEFSYYPTYWGV